MSARDLDCGRRQVDAEGVDAVLSDERRIAALGGRKLVNILSDPGAREYSPLRNGDYARGTVNVIAERTHPAAAGYEGFTVLERVERDADVLPPLVEEFSQRWLNVARIPRRDLLLPCLLPACQS